ncbi:MAG: HAD family phosphatase [Candidatus Moranbacteria bacterium]|nr:HAD family phosphatase [Candidatus Moranbacteria bacterium]
MKKFAILFDLDGTLVDTEILHAEAESKVLGDLGIHISPEEITRTYAGIPTESYIRELGDQKESTEDLMIKKRRILEALVRQVCIRPVPGMPGLISYLKNLEVPMFVVSSSDRTWIRKCLATTFVVDHEEHSYRDYFGENFISGSEVANPKPAPDVFMEAKRLMLGTNESLKSEDVEWIVVGDGLADMVGARSANMKALILGVLQDKPIDDKKTMFFSSSTELMTYIKNMFQATK